MPASCALGSLMVSFRAKGTTSEVVPPPAGGASCGACEVGVPRLGVRLRCCRRVALKAPPASDAGIAAAVLALVMEVDRFESCEGGRHPPHAEPALRFHRDMREGLRALGAAMNKGGLALGKLGPLWPIPDE